MRILEMKSFSIGQLCEKVNSGGTPNTRRPEYYGGNIPWLKTQEVNFNRIYKTETFISEDGLNNSSAKWIPTNSVIVAMYGATAGRIAINKIPLTTNQACCNLIIDSEKADYRYIYYNLLSRFDSIANMAVGGAQQNLNAGMIKGLPIDLPPLPTQKAIAEILSSLDDKIELNNQINQNLEALAQAIFKQWFVDFEFPNENGEPYKSSGGEMVDSELGEIPKGWPIVNLDKLLTIKYGKDHKGIPEGQIPIYGSGGIMRFGNRALYEKASILIPRKGTLTNLFFITDPFWSVDTMFYSEIHSDEFAEFLFFWIKSLDIASMNVGSAVPSMTTKVLNQLLVLKPDENTVRAFHEFAKGVFDTIKANNKENENLKKLRDTLLPKLISGELEINESLLEQTI